jgi:hypothetical protein
MKGKTLSACALLLALSLATFDAAHAHGLIGKRFFPATLATDDPFVADELSLPTISYLKLRGTEEAPPTKEIDLRAPAARRSTPRASTRGRPSSSSARASAISRTSSS